MYLMYVDESGDCGMPADGSPSNLFCLSGVVIHELAWRDTIAELLRFRRWLKGRYRLGCRAPVNLRKRWGPCGPWWILLLRLS